MSVAMPPCRLFYGRPLLKRYTGKLLFNQLGHRIYHSLWAVVSQLQAELLNHWAVIDNISVRDSPTAFGSAGCLTEKKLMVYGKLNTSMKVP